MIRHTDHVQTSNELRAPRSATPTYIIIFRHFESIQINATVHVAIFGLTLVMLVVFVMLVMMVVRFAIDNIAGSRFALQILRITR